ncbi:hypothetical protein ACOSQ3_018926 [Xanthoceras sorbifolium]
MRLDSRRNRIEALRVARNSLLRPPPLPVVALAWSPCSLDWLELLHRELYSELRSRLIIQRDPITATTSSRPVVAVSGRAAHCQDPHFPPRSAQRDHRSRWPGRNAPYQKITVLD